MRSLISIFFLFITLAVSFSARAQQCDETYITAEGDDLYKVAAQAYDDERKWSAIYYANQDVLGSDPGNVAAGIGLRIPCLDDASSPEPTPFQRLNADLKILTGGDYPPFTDQDLPGGGLLTELVNAAFDKSPNPVPYSLTWEDDWSTHLDPLIKNRVFDVGFPWFRPDCEADRESERCVNFHFSEPLFEMLIPLYYAVDNPVKFESDADIVGKTLCRPKGYFTHDMDNKDRRWITDGIITLVQADTIDDCFTMLVDAQVDGVTINEFTGRSKILSLDLQGKVIPAERPLSIEGLRLVIAKTHPRGTTFLYRFNAGLKELKKTKRYSGIIDRHLSNYWREIEDASVNPAPTGSLDTEDSSDTEATGTVEDLADTAEIPSTDDATIETSGEDTNDGEQTGDISTTPAASVDEEPEADPQAAATETTATESTTESIDIEQNTIDTSTDTMPTGQEATAAAAVTKVTKPPVSATATLNPTLNPVRETEESDDSDAVAAISTETNETDPTGTPDSTAVQLEKSTENAPATVDSAPTPTEDADDKKDSDVTINDDDSRLTIIPPDSESSSTEQSEDTSFETSIETIDEAADADKTEAVIEETVSETAAEPAIKSADLTKTPTANDRDNPSDNMKAGQTDTEAPIADDDAVGGDEMGKRCKAFPYFCRMFGLD